MLLPLLVLLLLLYPCLLLLHAWLWMMLRVHVRHHAWRRIA